MSGLSRLYGTARYGILIAAGACTFLGLALLMPIVGVTWHSNYKYLRLDTYVFLPIADLMIWVIAFAFSTFPFYASVKRDRRALRDPLLTFSNLMLPVASIVMSLWSSKVAVAGLTISGFIVAYALARRSPSLLRIASRDAFRIVATVTLTCLAALSTISIFGMAMGGEKTLRVLSTAAILSKEILSNPWLRAITLDLEFFFLLRPALPLLIVILVLAAVLAVLSGTVVDPVKLIRNRINRSRGLMSVNRLHEGRSSSHKCSVSVLLVVGSVLVGAYVTLYPYLFERVGGILGSDTWLYLAILRDSREPFAVAISSDRPLFVLFILGLKYLTGANALSVATCTPLILSVLLSLSSYALVREGTKDTVFASVAALFSVVSSQTAIGLGAAIFANWFALAVANFFFALLMRAQMNKSTAATALASVVSLLIMFAHPYVWAATMTMIAIQILGTLFVARSKPTDFRQNMVPLISIVLLNALFLSLASTQFAPMRGRLDYGMSMVVSSVKATNVTNLITILESTVDYARNRLDATAMIVLSIIGVADISLLPRPFRRILGSMMIVPVIFTLIAPDISWTWRGLCLLPTYLGATLGVRSIIIRANTAVARSHLQSALNFAFSSSLLGYVFLSSLAWTIRATLLLMETSVIAR